MLSCVIVQHLVNCQLVTFLLYLHNYFLEAESNDLFKGLRKINFHFYVAKELISESVFSTNDMLLQQIAKVKTPATTFLELRPETLMKGSETAGHGLEALKTFLKALDSSLSTMKYGFSEEKRGFFCVAEILSNFCASVTLNKMVYKSKMKMFKQEFAPK